MTSHLALISSSYPDGVHGQDAAGSFVADFAAILSRYTRVTVIAASRADSVTIEDALTVRRFSVPRLPLSLLNPLDPRDWRAIVRTLGAGRDAVSALAVTDRPDHILALWALPGGYWAQAAGRRRNIPYSVWALGSDIWGLGRIPLVRAKLRHVLRAASVRYADGLQLAADVERICARECEFLPSTRSLPTPATAGLASAPPYKLAFLGRWHPNKGVDLMLEALCRLSAEDWSKIDAVRICGGGPLHNEVEAAVHTLRARNHPVELGGYLDKQQAADLIGWADYFMLPSRIESIPVVLSDCIQLGTPLIATPVGDLPRLYGHGAVGVLARAPSADAFADALRSALGQAPRDYLPAIKALAATFDLDAIAQKFLTGLSLHPV